MSSKDTIHALLAAASQSAEMRDARGRWARRSVAALRAAQTEMDERCSDAVDRLNEEEFERLCDEEQAKVDAFLKPLKDAAERHLWPRELYFGCI
jgi:hypothetical protein